MEINEKDLLKVSGGMRELKPVETKDGTFVLVPDGCETFKSVEDANKKIEEMKEHRHCCKPHGHGGHRGHCGPGGPGGFGGHGGPGGPGGCAGPDGGFGGSCGPR